MLTLHTPLERVLKFWDSSDAVVMPEDLVHRITVNELRSSDVQKAYSVLVRALDDAIVHTRARRAEALKESDGASPTQLLLHSCVFAVGNSRSDDKKLTDGRFCFDASKSAVAE
jgi:hypothetical protein